ncbi:ATP-binding protein [Devosia sp.]|uniref:ATP-binding protein n=1 Tax=Devosia sp. TaxID=1871048 RepID=UPI002F22F2A9
MTAGPGDVHDGGPLDDRTLGRFADALPDPCIVLDRRAAVLHCNALAAQHFPGVSTGVPLAFSLRAPTLLAAIDAARVTGAAQTVELHQTIPTETWHRVSIAPLADGGRLVVVLQSLTEQKRLNAMRTDFIANVSHELRTPLTSLIGFIDTLLGPAARDEAARLKFLSIMRGQAARMSKLIDDLLSLSRIEMRQHVRPTGSVDVGRLLREVRDGLQTQAEAAGVALDLALPEEAAVVTGDRDELYEVFENLFDNAIKYGGDGGRVEVVLAPVSSRPGYAYMVTVADHGAGIEQEHVPRLTERFYRIDAESSRRKKGTGLGLAIVKHILNRHRGALAISSRPGEGTRVEVLLAR